MQVSAFADIQPVEEGLAAGVCAPDVVVEVQVVAVAVARVNLNKQTDDETNNPSKKKGIYIYIYIYEMDENAYSFEPVLERELLRLVVLGESLADLGNPP
jgi:Holliday junction resolvasome RuvABC DNA-binding subunit